MLAGGDDLRDELGTVVIGSAVYGRARVDSTNLEALRLAREGAPEGTIVVAATQTAGRGRLGRPWVDVPGGCLLVTALVRPPEGCAGLVTAAAALAVAETVRERLELPALIKWPNDVLIHDRKIAGVLAEGPAAGLVAVGIGVNVSGSSGDLPEGLRDRAGFLSEEAGAAVTTAGMLRALLPHLDRDYRALHQSGECAGLVQRLRGLDYLLGRRVVVRAAGREIAGEAAGWRDTGALVVRGDSGALHEFDAGEVSLS